jgi:hypothetical protein
VLAASHPSLLPSIIAAVAAVVAAVVAASALYVNGHAARKYTNLLRDIGDLVDESSDRTIEEIKQGIRDLVGTAPHHRRRWYET